MPDIPMEKVEQMRPFLNKLCKQAGALSQTSTLRHSYIPHVFEEHYAALKRLLQSSSPAMVHLSANSCVVITSSNPMKKFARELIQCSIQSVDTQDQKSPVVLY